MSLLPTPIPTPDDRRLPLPTPKAPLDPAFAYMGRSLGQHASAYPELSLIMWEDDYGCDISEYPTIDQGYIDLNRVMKCRSSNTTLLCDS